MIKLCKNYPIPSPFQKTATTNQPKKKTTEKQSKQNHKTQNRTAVRCSCMRISVIERNPWCLFYVWVLYIFKVEDATSVSDL